MSERIVCTNLSRKLYLVYFLNVVDYLCTLILVSTGKFYEANPLANTFIDNITMGVIIKCIVPFGLMFFVCRYLYILNFKELKFADMLVSFGLTVYIFILLDHIINFVLLIVL